MDLWNDSRDHRKIVHIDLSEAAAVPRGACVGLPAQPAVWASRGACNRIVRHWWNAEPSRAGGAGMPQQGALCHRSGRWVW